MNYSQDAIGQRINPQNQRAKGKVSNWADDLMSVQCKRIVDSVPEEYVFDPSTNGGCEILVFSNDFPVIVRPFHFEAKGAGGPLRAPRFNAFDYASLYGTTNELYTTNQALPLAEKEAAYGVTITNKVAVSGYPFLVFCYVDLITSMALEFDIATTGAVMAGKAGLALWNLKSMAPPLADQSDVVPCFLLESDYTQAIADNDNVYEYSWVESIGPGSINHTFKLYVCGIFKEVEINE
jgi:hypothetical protein